MSIRDALHYDPDTGIFTWKEDRNNGVKGEIAGWIETHGYLCIQYDNLSYKAHRIAWFLYYGVWPTLYIDHINGIKADNRIYNLREATKQQNNANSKIKFRGVYRHGNKWKAQLKQAGYLGLFKTREDAYAAVCAAHKRIYGEFSPCE